MIDINVLKKIIQYTELVEKSLKEKGIENFDVDVTTIFLMFYSDITRHDL